MEVCCPICRHPIEVAGDERDQAGTNLLGEVTSVSCPNCGMVPLLETPAKTPADTAPTKKFEDTQTFMPAGAEVKKVAHFSLVRIVGRGSFGEVWLAEDTHLGRQVALKLPVARADESINLLHEAQTAATLRHPNIVAVYEVGTEHDQIYIASEFIEGLTLSDVLSAGKPKVKRTAELLAIVADALHHAHDHGVVHRDIKPANILVNTAGQPYVTDFGIAKRISTQATISSEGRVIGTARYMSPEQASGKTQETDHRADIYAVGVILFEMLTGDAPFRGNLRAILHQKIFEEAPSPRTLDPALPKDLETMCLKCLEREPGKRYQSSRELSEEFRRFLSGEPIKARPISWLERGWRWRRRRPGVAALLFSLFLSLSVGLASVSYFSVRASQNATLMERSFYRSEMSLSSAHLENGDYEGLQRSLENFSPDGDLGHLRGFEWYYYQGAAAPLLQMINLGDVVRGVAISRDGDVVAAIARGPQIQIFEAKTGRLLRSLSIERGQFKSIAFSPSDDRLISGSSDGMIRVWTPRTSDAPVLQFKHGPPVFHARVSPNGKRILSAGDHGAVRVWEMATGASVVEVPSGVSELRDARFGPRGQTIAVATQDGLVRIWEIEGRTPLRRLEPNPELELIAFSDDGETIVAATYGGNLRMWSVSEGELQHDYSLQSGRIQAIEFLKDSPLLLILLSDGRLHVLDTASHHRIRQMKVNLLASGTLALSANGKSLVVGSDGGSVKVLRAKSLAQANVFWHDRAVRGVAFLPGGKRFLATSEDGVLQKWDLLTGHGDRLGHDGADAGIRLAVRPGGDEIITAGASPRMALWNAATGKFLRALDVPVGGVDRVAFSPDGRRLAVAARDGAVVVYATGQWNKAEFAAPPWDSRVDALAFSPDSSQLAVALASGETRLLDVTHQSWEEEPINIGSRGRALAFCEEGRILAIATGTGEIHLWDCAKQQTRSVIKAHSTRINALAVLGSGTLVSGGRDRNLKLWDSTSGQLISTFFGHRRQIFCIAVSPDGHAIASGGLEGDIRLWEAPLTK